VNDHDPYMRSVFRPEKARYVSEDVDGESRFWQRAVRAIATDPYQRITAFEAEVSPPPDV